MRERNKIFASVRRMAFVIKKTHSHGVPSLRIKKPAAISIVSRFLLKEGYAQKPSVLSVRTSIREGKKKKKKSE